MIYFLIAMTKPKDLLPWLYDKSIIEDVVLNGSLPTIEILI